MEEDGIEFELVAASLRADISDSGAFLGALAAKLQGALPNQTSVKYGGGLFGKKSIKGLDVDLGETRYHLEEDHGRLSPFRQKSVRGIVLKNEPLGLDAWLEDLSRTVTKEAQKSESGRLALQKMLEES